MAIEATPQAPQARKKEGPLAHLPGSPSGMVPGAIACAQGVLGLTNIIQPQSIESSAMDGLGALDVFTGVLALDEGVEMLQTAYKSGSMVEGTFASLNVAKATAEVSFGLTHVARLTLDFTDPSVKAQMVAGRILGKVSQVSLGVYLGAATLLTGRALTGKVRFNYKLMTTSDKKAFLRDQVMLTEAELEKFKEASTEKEDRPVNVNILSPIERASVQDVQGAAHYKQEKVMSMIDMVGKPATAALLTYFHDTPEADFTPVLKLVKTGSLQGLLKTLIVFVLISLVVTGFVLAVLEMPKHDNLVKLFSLITTSGFTLIHASGLVRSLYHNKPDQEDKLIALLGSLVLAVVGGIGMYHGSAQFRMKVELPVLLIWMTTMLVVYKRSLDRIPHKE